MSAKGESSSTVEPLICDFADTKIHPAQSDGDGDGDGDGNELVYVDYADDDDSMDDTDDEELSVEFDSDMSKKCKWFKNFFESLDALSLEEVNNQQREWQCPACQFGPGAINWYRGLQPLITHAQTKGRKRVKLHRELAKLLEKELRQRGAQVIPVGEAFGKWKGLMDYEKHHLIVWPPMVVIMNTRLEQVLKGQVQFHKYKF